MVHPVLFSTGRDDWETPQELYDELDSEFHFQLDVAASETNHKCKLWITKEFDGLKYPWAKSNWCNPPYHSKNIEKWILKALDEQDLGNTTVMLVPARTDTRWFHNYIYKTLDIEIRFIKGRVQFSKIGCAPFPSMLIIFRSNVNQSQ